MCENKHLLDIAAASFFFVFVCAHKIIMQFISTSQKVSFENKHFAPAVKVGLLIFSFLNKYLSAWLRLAQVEIFEVLQTEVILFCYVRS